MKQQTRPDPGRRRYRLLAPIYDWASTERPLYASARSRAIELLQLRPGDTVLDVACGTGMNFELIERRIGPSGRLVGVDRSPQMLARARARARARVAKRGWTNVRLVEIDVARLSEERLRTLGALAPGTRFDAVLCTLGLSVIPQWESAWQTALALARPGGRVAVMDAGYPTQPGEAGEVVAFRPIAWFLCRLFAADGRRQPWELVERDTDDTTVERFTCGYIGVAAGTCPYTLVRDLSNPSRR